MNTSRSDNRPTDEDRRDAGGRGAHVQESEPFEPYEHSRRVERVRKPGLFGGEPRSESSDTEVSLLSFIGPRYWRVWLLIAWLKLAVKLPWRRSLALHKRLGRWLGGHAGRSAELVRNNLATCFPELASADREALAMRYYENLGASVAELALAWFAPRDKLAGLFEIQGAEHVARALERGSGVILSTGHFTPVELCSIAIKEHAPRYTLIYNPRRSRLLSEYQRRCRERYSDELYPKRNVRAMIKSLRRNAVVWYAADEAHTGKSSVVLPFFGEPALTNTALPRLAEISGAAVVPLFYCRKDDDSGYLIRFGPALEGFPSDDIAADTLRLTELLEASIRECPAQYFWSQKRFRRRRTAAPES